MPSNLTSTDARITYTSKPHKLATKHRRCTGRHAKQSSTEASITPQEERRFLARRAQEIEQRRVAVTRGAFTSDFLARELDIFREKIRAALRSELTHSAEVFLCL